MSREFYKASIRLIIDESPIVKRFVLAYSDGQKRDFIPGQFVILDFEGLEDTYTTRSYSIASSPGDYSPNELELVVVYKSEGKATPLLFNMHVGDSLMVSDPVGGFTLDFEKLVLPLYLICTGTGVAPFRSILGHIFNLHLSFKEIHLFFGTREESGLLYRREFEKRQMTHPGFHYYPILSRSEWSGRKGYVHQHYLPMIQSKPDAYFMVCGWAEMVKESRDNLKVLGYTRKDYKIELYD